MASADYGLLGQFKGVTGAQKEAKASNLANQLAQAQIAKAQREAMYPDVDKLGEQAFFKAAQGIQLTPQEEAAAKFVNAKSGGVAFDPNTGTMFQKPSIASNLGINFGGLDPNRPATSQGFVPPQAAQNMQNYANQPNNAPQPNNPSPIDIPTEPQNAWDIQFEQEMAKAAGNPKLQQSIRDAYAKAKISQTEAEAKNEGYANRLLQAEPILTDPKKVEAYSNFWQKAGDFINPFGAQLQSEDYRLYKQAKTNAATARLRQESGATISPSEFDVDAEQLYPQVGDTPDILEQKRQNRETIKNSLMRAAGPAYKPAPILSPKAAKSKADFEAKKSKGKTINWSDL